MSGHNKWSKIKHKKAASDAQKSKVFSKHSAVIAMESRKAGGHVESPNLAAAIERAKKDSMPKNNIERAIAKGSSADGSEYQEVMYEAYGPGGVGMLVTAVTDNNNRTAAEIKSIFTKSGYSIGTPGSAQWAFTKTETGYVPNVIVDLSEADEAKLATLVEALDDQDDVQNIYTAADRPEDETETV